MEPLLLARDIERFMTTGSGGKLTITNNNSCPFVLRELEGGEQVQVRLAHWQDPCYLVLHDRFQGEARAGLPMGTRFS